MKPRTVMPIKAKLLLPHVEFKRSEQPTPALPFRVTYTLDQVRDWVKNKSAEDIGVVNVVILYWMGHVYLMVQDGCHRVEAVAEIDGYVMVQVEIYTSPISFASEYSDVTLSNLLKHQAPDAEILTQVLLDRQAEYCVTYWHNGMLNLNEIRTAIIRQVVFVNGSVCVRVYNNNRFECQLGLNEILI